MEEQEILKRAGSILGRRRGQNNLKAYWSKLTPGQRTRRAKAAQVASVAARRAKKEGK